MPTTELRSRLTACRDAEDYFALLEVPYDPHVLQVNRLHVLRLFADPLQEFLTAAATDEPVARQRLRAALAAAHDAFTGSSALDHRLFKVLRDRAPDGFVALDDVAVEVAR